VHEEDSEVVVVESVSGCVGALAEVASLGELVAASCIAAPLIFHDASNTVAADLVPCVDASTQAPLIDGEGCANEGGVGDGGCVGINVAILNCCLSWDGISLDAAP
jgi:hypothetical protein